MKILIKIFENLHEKLTYKNQIVIKYIKSIEKARLGRILMVIVFDEN